MCSQVDVYPSSCGLSPPVGVGLNGPATIRLASRSLVAAVAASQRARAEATGAVRLTLTCRSASRGDPPAWETYEVPVGGGKGTLVDAGWGEAPGDGSRAAVEGGKEGAGGENAPEGTGGGGARKGGWAEEARECGGDAAHNRAPAAAEEAAAAGRCLAACSLGAARSPLDEVDE